MSRDLPGIANADEFKEARLRQGLTKAQVASLMKLPRPEITGYQTVSRWERTGAIPGPALAHMDILATGWRPKWWSKGK